MHLRICLVLGLSAILAVRAFRYMTYRPKEEYKLKERIGGEHIVIDVGLLHVLPTLLYVNDEVKSLFICSNSLSLSLTLSLDLFIDLRVLEKYTILLYSL